MGIWERVSVSPSPSPQHLDYFLRQVVSPKWHLLLGSSGALDPPDGPGQWPVRGTVEKLARDQAEELAGWLETWPLRGRGQTFRRRTLLRRLDKGPSRGRKPARVGPSSVRLLVPPQAPLGPGRSMTDISSGAGGGALGVTAGWTGVDSRPRRRSCGFASRRSSAGWGWRAAAGSDWAHHLRM
jgi:hypothetical protein